MIKNRKLKRSTYLQLWQIQEFFMSVTIMMPVGTSRENTGKVLKNWIWLNKNGLVEKHFF